MTNMTSFQPLWASPPGDTIKDILTEKKLSIANFAKSMNLNPTNIRDLIKGNYQIDQEVAENLSLVLGSSNSFWLQRQKDYLSDLELIATREKAMQDWLDLLPIKDMSRLKWLNFSNTLESKTNAALEFFDVSSIDEWYSIYKNRIAITSFRTSASFDSTPESVISWLRRGELIAQDCKNWNSAEFKKSLSTARAYSRTKDPAAFLPKLRALFAECGVALVIVPNISKCHVNGATYFCNPNKAILQLSFRYLSDDHFWFTLFHEAGHLLLHGKTDLFLEGAKFDSEEEKEANQFAFDILIPKKDRSEFYKLDSQNWKKIPRFAKKIGTSSGIIVGQLQHHGLVKHNYLNKLKVRYKWKDENKNYIV